MTMPSGQRHPLIIRLIVVYYFSKTFSRNVMSFYYNTCSVNLWDKLIILCVPPARINWTLIILHNNNDCNKVCTFSQIYIIHCMCVTFYYINFADFIKLQIIAYFMLVNLVQKPNNQTKIEWYRRNLVSIVKFVVFTMKTWFLQIPFTYHDFNNCGFIKININLSWWFFLTAKMSYFI